MSGNVLNPAEQDPTPAEAHLHNALLEINSDWSDWGEAEALKRVLQIAADALVARPEWPLEGRATPSPPDGERVKRAAKALARKTYTAQEVERLYSPTGSPAIRESYEKEAAAILAAAGPSPVPTDDERECICGHPKIAHEDDTREDRLIYFPTCPGCGFDLDAERMEILALEAGSEDELVPAGHEGCPSCVSYANAALAADREKNAGTRKDDASRTRPTDERETELLREIETLRDELAALRPTPPAVLPTPGSGSFSFGVASPGSSDPMPPERREEYQRRIEQANERHRIDPTIFVAGRGVPDECVGEFDGNNVRGECPVCGGETEHSAGYATGGTIRRIGGEEINVTVHQAARIRELEAELTALRDERERFLPIVEAMAEAPLTKWSVWWIDKARSTLAANTDKEGEKP